MYIMRCFETILLRQRRREYRNDFEKIAYSIIQQTAYLSYRSPGILIISEENLVRPHSDIFKKWRSKISHESAANYSCAALGMAIISIM